MSYEKLQINSDPNAGSFVRTLQGATGTGFQDGTHVHKDWWAKTQTYEQVMQACQMAVENREDIMVATKDIACVADKGHFYIVE